MEQIGTGLLKMRLPTGKLGRQGQGSFDDNVKSTRTSVSRVVKRAHR